VNIKPEDIPQVVAILQGMLASGDWTRYKEPKDVVQEAIEHYEALKHEISLRNATQDQSGSDKSI